MTITPTTKAMPSGRLVDLMNMESADINMGDICTTLAGINRWNGTHGKFYSVASHSLLVGDIFVNKFPAARCDQLASALMHDAAEAYVGDIVSPAKRAMRKIAVRAESHFDELEDIVARAIAAQFDLPTINVKSADDFAFHMESWALFGCVFQVEWRKRIDGYADLTIDDVLIVPEIDAGEQLKEITNCCLHPDQRAWPARDFWLDVTASYRRAA